ncbi:hypothetical protein ONZ45_g7719 [Pleurotus djamor]|nr:hypothetical protein ONZ45_g7719 [Pleurotus djamor]
MVKILKIRSTATVLLSILAVASTAMALTPKEVCNNIKAAVSSSSDVYFPINLVKYNEGISHWAVSSTQRSACVVEPGTAEDVSVIIKQVGETRTPFAIKGGGHTTNPGFSSTIGVHIAMSRFNKVVYSPETQTVTYGAGLLWDDVYAALEPYAVNVVGGRVSGVGVAGFTLGGGYSWKTNQFGLTADNILAYELVKPNGDIVTVTEVSDDALFFALKGGYNNFGIVTKFTAKTFPQTYVWAGLITYTFPHLDAVNAATAKFSAEVTDPKASIIPAYNFVLGQPGVSLLVFYDAPTPPAGIFNDFLAIPHFTNDVSTRTFLSFVQGSPSQLAGGQRAVFHTVPLLGYSESLLKAIVNESVFWGQRLSWKSATLLSYDVEPFLPTILNHGADAAAYPPTRAQSFLPLNLYFAWTLEAFDDAIHDAIKLSAARIMEVALAEGQGSSLTSAPLYGNYAISDTPISKIFGDKLPLLQQLQAIVDPDNVMGLAGGWKI